MFDLLMAADMFVDDPDAVTAQLVANIGLPPPKDIWKQGPDGYRWHTIFARVNFDVSASPTRLEILGVDVADPMPHLAARFRLQTSRSAKTHSTVLTIATGEQVVDQLRRRHVRFMEEVADENFPFSRVWLGLSDDDSFYDPSADGGLMIELIPTDGLNIPRQPRNDAPEGVKEGEMLRIEARRFMVHDLDETLRALDRNLGLVPAGTVVTGKSGYRKALFVFDYDAGATLELLEPSGDSGEVGAYYEDGARGPTRSGSPSPALKRGRRR